MFYHYIDFKKKKKVIQIYECANHVIWLEFGESCGEVQTMYKHRED